MDWLSDYLLSNGGQVLSADAKKAGHSAGHGDKALRRARERLRLTVTSTGFPRVTYWEISVVPAIAPPSRGEGTTDLTGHDWPSHASRVSHARTDGVGPTEGTTAIQNAATRDSEAS